MGTESSDPIEGEQSIIGSVQRYMRVSSGEGLSFSHFLVLPTVVWYVVFLVFPLLVVAYYSFLTYESYNIIFELTLHAWTDIVFAPGTVEVFARTLGIGIVVTVLTLIFAYPLAYYLRFYASETGGIVLLLFLIIPFWNNALVRTMAWIPLLGKTGLINQILIQLGLIEQPISWLLFSPFSQVVGYIQSYIVFMAAPIYVSMSQINEDLLSASETLRGDPLTTFKKVVWPLSRPGVAIGILFVFVLSIGNLLVPQVLSGGKSTVSTKILVFANRGLNYPASSALSISLLLVIFVCILALLRVVDISEIASE